MQITKQEVEYFLPAREKYCIRDTMTFIIFHQCWFPMSCVTPTRRTFARSQQKSNFSNRNVMFHSPQFPCENLKKPIFFFFYFQRQNKKWSQDLGNERRNGKWRFLPHNPAHNSPIARWGGNSVEPSNAGGRRIHRISLRVSKWHGLCAGQSAWRATLPADMGQHSLLATHKTRILCICELHVWIQGSQVWHIL